MNSKLKKIIAFCLIILIFSFTFKNKFIDKIYYLSSKKYAEHYIKNNYYGKMKIYESKYDEKRREWIFYVTDKNGINSNLKYQIEYNNFSDGYYQDKAILYNALLRVKIIGECFADKTYFEDLSVKSVPNKKGMIDLSEAEVSIITSIIIRVKSNNVPEDFWEISKDAIFSLGEVYNDKTNGIDCKVICENRDGTLWVYDDNKVYCLANADDLFVFFGLS